QRVIFGRPIGANQGVQFAIARAHISTDAAQLMRDKAAALFDAGQPCGGEANMAKYLGAEAAWEAGNACIDCHGGYGYGEESDAGVPRIEVTSFVHPKVVPQLRDAEAVMAKIRRRPGVRYAALVPNDKGAVRAVDAGVNAIHTVVSASESHNLANVNMTIAESMEKLRAVMQVAARAKVAVSCGISTSFGCPFEGDVPLDQLESVVGRLVDMGARAIG